MCIILCIFSCTVRCVNNCIIIHYVTCTIIFIITLSSVISYPGSPLLFSVVSSFVSPFVSSLMLSVLSLALTLYYQLYYRVYYQSYHHIYHRCIVNCIINCVVISSSNNFFVGCDVSSHTAHIASECVTYDTLALRLWFVSVYYSFYWRFPRIFTSLSNTFSSRNHCVCPLLLYGLFSTFF
jgi:hypothetical protein